MKVLVWSQYYWPENFHINDVVAEMKNQQIEVTVLTGKPNYPDGDVFSGYTAFGVHIERVDSVEVIRLPLIPRGKDSAVRLLLNYLSFIVMGYLLAPWVLRNRQFDAVFVYAPSPIFQALPAKWIAWLKRAPLVIWVQDLWPESLRATGFVDNKWVLKLIESAVACVYKGAERILIQSEAFRPSVVRLLGAQRASNVHYFPNSASPLQEATDVVDTPTICSAMSSCFSIVFAGNIGHAQACETIVDAAAQLKEYADVQFFIVGSGSQMEFVAQRVAALGLQNVSLVGRVAPDQMGPIYASASALLLTLKADPVLAMTVPSKFQGYLAAGKPIIVSCNGEVARIVAEAHCGFAVTAQDSKLLADAVFKLYQSTPELRTELGRCGRNYYLENFVLSDNVGRLKQVLAAAGK